MGVPGHSGRRGGHPPFDRERGPQQSRRGVVAGRRWPGGGAVTLIVWREGGSVVLSHEGAAVSTARLTAEQAVTVADLLRAAAGAAT